MLVITDLKWNLYYIMHILTSLLLSIIAFFGINIKKEEKKIESILEDGLVMKTIPENEEVITFPEKNVIKKSTSSYNFSTNISIEKDNTYTGPIINNYNICFLCKKNFYICKSKCLYRAYDNNICQRCYCMEINKIH